VSTLAPKKKIGHSTRSGTGCVFSAQANGQPFSAKVEILLLIFGFLSDSSRHSIENSLTSASEPPAEASLW